MSEDSFDDGAQPEKPEYKVGYGRPPLEHRFRKNASGNPKGRPKLSRNRGKSKISFAQIILDESYKSYKFDSKDGPIDITAFRAIVKSACQSAIKGNPKSQSLILKAVSEAEGKIVRDKAAYREVKFDEDEVRAILENPVVQAEIERISSEKQSEFLRLLTYDQREQLREILELAQIHQEG